MTDLTAHPDTAALSAGAALSSPECCYKLTCYASGLTKSFTAIPTPLDVRLALLGLYLYGGPSLVVAGALAERVVERGEAEYGCWGLEVVG